MSDVEPVDPLLLPIIVGVTGHCDLDLGSPAIDCVKRSIVEVLKGLVCQFGKAVHVMTALAEGADQLVAAEASALGIDLITVMPMAREPYIAGMSQAGRANFEKLVAASTLTMTLPYLPPAENGMALDFDQRHYRQLAAFLARRSHFLLALWDGADDPTVLRNIPKPGGTADVLHLRADLGHAAAVERCSPLFGHNGSPLDAIRSGLVLCVTTPRATGPAPFQPGSRAPVAPGRCFMLAIDNAPTNVPPLCSWFEVTDPKRAIDAADTPTKQDFERLKELNEQIGALEPEERFVLNQHFTYLKTADMEPQVNDPVHRLKRFQASVDTAAQHFQRAMVGSFGASKITDLPEKIATAWRDYCNGQRAMPSPNVLTTYGLLLPILVILFEAYSKLGWHWAFLAAYFVASGAAFAVYQCVVKHRRWQDRWQDYRALAEGLRVQLYWALSALPMSIGDNYLRKQDTELGWIKFASQGPAVWAAAQSLAMKIPHRAAVMAGWIDDQAGYFIGQDGKARLNHHAAKRNELFAKCFYVFGLIAVGALVLWHILDEVQISDTHGLAGCFHRLLADDDLRKYIDVFAVAMPAFAAYLTLMTNQRAYEAHARSYSQMGTAFRRAHTIAQSIPDSADPDHHNTDAFKKLVRELGREALAETAEWLMDHRDRRIEPPS